MLCVGFVAVALAFSGCHYKQREFLQQLAMPAKKPPIPANVVREDQGGVIKNYVVRWQDIASRGGEVDVLGPCGSACTLVVAYIPRDKLCFGQKASLQFHAAREPDGKSSLGKSSLGKSSLWATQWMIKTYPDDIKNWLADRGGDVKMTVQTVWTLPAKDLWKMGYRRCNA
jgi:hypothetical protein